LTDQIKAIEKELEELNDKLDSLQAAQAAVGAVAGAAIPAAMLLANAFPPFSQVILVCLSFVLCLFHVLSMSRLAA
jgi:uncharacterized protein YacL